MREKAERYNKKIQISRSGTNQTHVEVSEFKMSQFLSTMNLSKHISNNRHPCSSFRTTNSTRINSTPPGPIDLIISDVDGTLLDGEQKLRPAVVKAINDAHSLGVPLIVATGKALGPWRHDVLPQLPASKHLPGVFLQGLLVTTSDGSITNINNTPTTNSNHLFSRYLEPDIIADAITFAHNRNLTLTAYCGDRIFCEHTNHHTDRLIWYREPTPEVITSLSSLVIIPTTTPIFKLIFLAEESQISQIQPEAEALFHGRAALTRALKGMLEVLPQGASKGAGVEWLLKNELNIHPDRVMALGDAENDIEMLKLVGWGVAMGNAGEKVKAVADAVVRSNEEDGVAEAIEKFVLAPRRQQQMMVTDDYR
jgi:Cof subfamily protein (haloacid dehalogenase superfamily)